MTTNDKMPDDLFAQRSERFGYIASPHRVEVGDVKYIRADIADARVEKLVEALRLVLTTVGDCHDCWKLSASDQDVERVNALLAQHEGEG